MKIIIYNPNTNEWNQFIDSLGCDYKGIERNKAIQAYITKTGQEISVQEFINNNYLYTSWSSKLRYKFIGEPCNPLEKIVMFVYSGPTYINMKRLFPEDFTESRTDWDDMVNYADEMESFIKEIMEDMLNIQLSSESTESPIKQADKTKNKVKFFVKAMGDNRYHLYIENKNENFMFISTHVDFNSFGLDIKDFADMKEGQLREVYLNLGN